MSDDIRNGDDLSSQFEDEIERACDRFEAEWKAGAEPEIKKFITEAPPPARNELERELLKLDIHYRRKREDTILPHDYTADYPEHASLIATLLGPCLLEEMPTEPTHAGRYRLEDPIGHGGMGDVYRAHDPDFRRPLAVKILKEEFKNRPELVARFLEEAQITGQLQHPGVPPVHEIGRLPDGRPFLAMKLIEGRTLAKLLAERQHPSDGLPRLLTIFEHICQAVAYAHSRRVLHRDLKPANVMVGAFGEVQVMDWGLAKMLSAKNSDRDSSERPESNTLQTLRSDTVVGPTMRGAVLGTLAYMPPEQARGEVDQVDARSDVFGLGAILCELLTGQPPYCGRTHQERWQLAKTADLADAFARLDASGADSELIALVRKCLAAEKGLRPGDAGALANAVAAYQAEVQERLRRAELERAAAQVRAEEARVRVQAERRARRLTVGLAATVLLLLGAGGGGSWWMQQQRQTRAAEEALRQQRTDNEVTVALSDARLQREQAKGAPLGDGGRFREALAAAHKAVGLAETGEASAELRQQAAELVGELGREAMAAEHDRKMLVRLAEVRSSKEDEFSPGRADGEYAKAFQEYDLDLDVLEPAEAAARIRARPEEVAAALTAAMDDWALERRARGREAGWRRLLAAARAADSDPWRDRVRAHLERLVAGPKRPDLELAAALGLPGVAGQSAWALAAGLRTAIERAPLVELATGAEVERLSPPGVVLLASALQAAGAGGTAELLLRRALRRHPGDVWLNYELAQTLERQPQPDMGEVVRFYTAARAVRPEVGHALGHALQKQGKPDEAVTVFEELVRLRPDNNRHLMCLDLALESTAKLALHKVGARFSPEQYREGNVNRVTNVFFMDSQLTDAGLKDHLKHLKVFKNLENLAFVRGTHLTDAGLEDLKDLNRLQWLQLAGTHVTDAGLKHLKDFKDLKVLILSGTRVTDAGLEHLKGLKELDFLDLSGTRVTDAGLKHLKDLKRLRRLTLHGTQVTEAGLKDFDEAVPNCSHSYP
jgi:serine/threonine-protein kinase